MGIGCADDGNGLSGVVVNNAPNICPWLTKAGTSLRISAFMTSCCPVVGCRIEGSLRIVVKADSRRISPS